jgi:hypothetical protein
MPRSLAALLAAALLPTLAPAAELKLLLPQGRTAFQTDEWIDVSAVRSDAQALPAAKLTLTLKGRDGSSFTATFPLPAATSAGRGARQTEHLHLHGWLLRPGAYTVELACDGATAKADIDVFSHVRQSSFRLVNWGRAKGKEQLAQGADSFGYNTFYGHYAADEDANFLRAGVDFIANCVMSGGHQMDLRNECDWSDPLVTKGGAARVVRRAFIDRTRPNVPGVHFYDEPGLTWEKNDATGDFTPHMIRAQVRSYEAAFGRLPLPYHKVDPKNPDDVARWRQWALWKLGLMDAAWKEAQFGVSWVRPDYLSLTQSQYGWSAFTDGYYFNVVRSLPVTSGHGGYHDFGPGYFNPSYFLEMSRARDRHKPCWYLPTWYGNTTTDQMRLEQYLSFQTNVQGMITPPDCEPATNAGPRQGIVESNQLMKRLGPIFTTMPVTKPPVAMLYSLSQNIHTQTQDRSRNYAHEMPQGKNLPLTYLAGTLLHQPFMAVVEEDILDGTLASEHKAIVLTSLDYLDPQVTAALESFAAGGGLVLLTGDCTVKIKGAVTLPVKPAMPDQAKIDELMAAKKYDQLGPYTTTGKHLEGAAPLAKAIGAELARKGIKPVCECDQPGVVVTRQAAGDVEYLFAVNASTDEANPKDRLALKSVAAAFGLPDDGRPVYDAVLGGKAAFAAKDGGLTATARFGPGQMRVFARTARPVGGVKAATPVVVRELVKEKEPLRIVIAATLLDDRGGVLSGSVPLHIAVIDPLGAVRHELYRATELGTCRATLPLAANDPDGTWKVVVRELLSGTEDTTTFTYAPPPRAGSLAGATQRAVFFGDDRDKVFRFARLFHEVSVVKGTSPYCDAAAKRLAKALAPWGVRCKEVPLEQAAKSRSLTEEEARTWVGLDYAGKGQIKPGDGNPPVMVGFAVQGPVILLGSPEDNRIIKFLVEQKFLPYKPEAGAFPGVSRGYVAWQREAVGRGQESVALIAHDEAGMAEAVGSFFEMVAGLEPLTRWRLPEKDALTPAKTAERTSAATVAWEARLPDRVEALAPARGVTALTHDGSLVTLTPAGVQTNVKVLSAAEHARTLKEMLSANASAVVPPTFQRADRLLKFGAAEPNGKRFAVAYWGGTLRVGEADGKAITEQQLPQDVTALAWTGERVIVGLADGRVLSLVVK